MDIKKHAQAIVAECERIERVKKCIAELSRGNIEQINLSRYISQANHHNIEVYISARELPSEAIEAIKNLVIRKLEDSLTQPPEQEEPAINR